MSTKDAPPRREPGFVSKLLVAALILALLLAFWRVSQVVLLGFGGVVVAVAFKNIASPLAGKTHLSEQLALGVTVVGLILVTVGFFALFGSAASSQFGALIEQLPGAWDAAREWLQSWATGRWLLDIVEQNSTQAIATVMTALPLAGGLLGGLGNAFLILVLGIYLAADSRTYVDGFLRLLPPERRPRTRQIMDAAANDLRKWLNAMSLDMLFLGVITGIGLWLVGVPFSFALGVLSGLSVFVPYIGPIVATVPGLLLALSVSPQLALYAAIVYVVAQQLEGNISLPLLQRWTVSMPPVVSLLAMVAFGLLFGLWGILLATPMAVATMTIVRMAYVEDVLERRSMG
jgi:predicted PurR-regulated permease PerM